MAAYSLRTSLSRVFLCHSPPLPLSPAPLWRKRGKRTASGPLNNAEPPQCQGPLSDRLSDRPNGLDHLMQIKSFLFKVAARAAHAAGRRWPASGAVAGRAARTLKWTPFPCRLLFPSSVLSRSFLPPTPPHCRLPPTFTVTADATDVRPPGRFPSSRRRAAPTEARCDLAAWCSAGAHESGQKCCTIIVRCVMCSPQ